jgi:hypothetical protein
MPTNATPTTTPDDEMEALRQEWYAMHRELVAKMGGTFAADLESNFGMRAAGDLNPLLDGLRSIDSLLVSLSAEEAEGVGEEGVGDPEVEVGVVGGGDVEVGQLVEAHGGVVVGGGGAGGGVVVLPGGVDGDGGVDADGDGGVVGGEVGDSFGFLGLADGLGDVAHGGFAGFGFGGDVRGDPFGFGEGVAVSLVGAAGPDADLAGHLRHRLVLVTVRLSRQLSGKSLGAGHVHLGGRVARGRQVGAGALAASMVPARSSRLCWASFVSAVTGTSTGAGSMESISP